MDPSELDGFHAAAVYQHAEINATGATDPKSSRQRASEEEYQTLRSAPLAHLAVWPIPLFRLLGQLEITRKWEGYGLMCNFVRKSS